MVIDPDAKMLRHLQGVVGGSQKETELGIPQVRILDEESGYRRLILCWTVHRRIQHKLTQFHHWTGLALAVASTWFPAAAGGPDAGEGHLYSWTESGRKLCFCCGAVASHYVTPSPSRPFLGPTRHQTRGHNRQHGRSPMPNPMPNAYLDFPRTQIPMAGVWNIYGIPRPRTSSGCTAP